MGCSSMPLDVRIPINAWMKMIIWVKCPNVRNRRLLSLLDHACWRFSLCLSSSCVLIPLLLLSLCSEEMLEKSGVKWNGVTATHMLRNPSFVFPVATQTKVARTETFLPLSRAVSDYPIKLWCPKDWLNCTKTGPNWRKRQFTTLAFTCVRLRILHLEKSSTIDESSTACANWLCR